MPVAIPNFEYSYRRNGKPVFVPSIIGRRIGNEIKENIESLYRFDPIYFHMRRGGHVAAIHHHRENLYFARIDIKNFFYSISRRRVQSALDRFQIPNARFYSKWSTVANPYNDPPYALPCGFVQSPILASLVIATSQIGQHLLDLPNSINTSVYMDDISISSNDKDELENAYAATLEILKKDGFQCSLEKLRAPAYAIDVFNCDLTYGVSKVKDTRVVKFFDGNPNEVSELAFNAYCESVKVGNRE